MSEAITSPVDVRPFREADLAALERRWPTAGVHAAHAAAHVAGRATYLVAWNGPEPLGVLMVQWAGCVGPRAAAAHPEAVEFNHVQVRGSARGRGVGTALLVAAERLAAARGVATAAVGVAEDNPGARRLYERCGFVETGVVDRTAYDWVDDAGGTHHAVELDHLLVKDLRD